LSELYTKLDSSKAKIMNKTIRIATINFVLSELYTKLDSSKAKK